MGPILVAFLVGLALLALSTWLTAREPKTPASQQAQWPGGGTAGVDVATLPGDVGSGP